jgi:hypothetical protein
MYEYQFLLLSVDVINQETAKLVRDGWEPFLMCSDLLKTEQVQGAHGDVFEVHTSMIGLMFRKFISGGSL